MRIEGVIFAEQESDFQLALVASRPDAKFVAFFKVMLTDEFLRDRNCVRGAKPALNVETARCEIRRIESAERRVRENVDAEDFKIVSRKIRQRDESMDERRRRGDSRHGRNLRQDRFRQMPGR
jgi:hypothetical protein